MRCKGNGLGCKLGIKKRGVPQEQFELVRFAGCGEGLGARDGMRHEAMFFEPSLVEACCSGTGFGLDRSTEVHAPRAGCPLHPDSIAAEGGLSVGSSQLARGDRSGRGRFVWIPQ